MTAPLPVLIALFGALALAPAALGSYAVVQRGSAAVQLAWFGALALGLAGVLIAGAVALVDLVLG